MSTAVAEQASPKRVKPKPKPKAKPKSKAKAKPLRPRAQAKPAKTRKTRKGLSQEQLHQQFPVLKGLTGPGSSAENWDRALAKRPDVIPAMLSDLIKIAYAEPGKVGQRPMPKEQDVDVDDIIHGEVAEVPMPELLPKLIVSQRDFARRTGMSRTQIQRVINGELEPDLEQIERMADAVRKPPMYFLEYRHQLAMTLFERAIQDRPVMAMRLIQAAQDADQDAA